MTELTQAKVLLENATAHDAFSLNHDQAVSYIRRRKNREFYQNIVSKHALRRTKLNVLEIGCGTGTFCDYFISNGALSYTGIDISCGMIARANEKYGAYPNVKFVQSSIEDASTHMTYDLVVSSSLLHHFFSLEDGVRKIHNLLSPGGMYLGLHEPINRAAFSTRDRVATVLDGLFAAINGYDEWASKSRLKRGAAALYLVTPSAVRSLLKAPKSLTDSLFGRKVNLNCSASVSLEPVDYQLNFNFDEKLKNIVHLYNGTVHRYAYFHLLELAQLLKVSENYGLVIIEK